MEESCYSPEQESNHSSKRSYNRVTEEIKSQLFLEVFQNKLKITKASLKIGLNLSTAKLLIKKYRQQNQKALRKEAKREKCLINHTIISTSEDNKVQTVCRFDQIPLIYYYYCSPQTFFPNFNTI